MLVLKIPCLIAAAFCFGLKAFNVNIAGIDLMNLGFMFTVLSFLL
jgi:hypothetical protein